MPWTFYNSSGQQLKTTIGLTQAVQSDIEAETNQDTYIPPDLARLALWAIKGWIQIPANGVVTPSAANSNGVTSVADTGTGNRLITWDLTMGSTTYLLVASTDTSSNNIQKIEPTSTTTSQWVIAAADSGFAAEDVLGSIAIAANSA